jgi:hypothetical protein
MQELSRLRKLVKVFSTRDARFPLERDAHARELAAGQPRIWNILLGEITREITQGGQGDPALVNALNSLNGQITDRYFSVVKHPTEFVVHGRIPVLQDTNALTDLTSTPIYLLAAVVVETLDYVWQNWKPSGAAAEPTMLAGFSYMPLLVAITEYTAVKLDAASEQDAAQTQEGIAKDVAAAQSTIDLLKEDAARAAQVQSQLFDTRLLEAGKKDQEQREQWTVFLHDSQQQVEALKAQMHETNALQTATSVWQHKQTRHRATFGFGLAALALTIAALVALFLLKAPELLAQLPRKSPDNDIPYGVVALCFVPIIAIGWILRIGARWITNSLTLGEDAEQRRAMLDTYFSLVGDPNAKMEETDRILILNAIFRPLPGYQTEDVAPPTLLDLAKDAVSKK